MRKSNSPRLKKTSIQSNNVVDMNADMLKLYLAIDEKKPILEIFQETELERTAFKESLIRLYKMKLISQVDESSDYIDESLLNRFHEVLLEVAGPMGGVLLEDTAEEMNLELTKIPKSQIADFVYRVGSNIPGTKQATEFKEIMLAEIKKLNN